jgi:hypothetical protein
VFKEAVERDTGILTEVDTYEWITFLPMSDGGGAYNRYFGKLNTGKMKIRGVMLARATPGVRLPRCSRKIRNMRLSVGIRPARYNWAVFTICSFNVSFLNDATTSTQAV